MGIRFVVGAECGWINAQKSVLHLSSSSTRPLSSLKLNDVAMLKIEGWICFVYIYYYKCVIMEGKTILKIF
jgi:hypothetical protein